MSDDLRRPLHGQDRFVFICVQEYPDLTEGDPRTISYVPTNDSEPRCLDRRNQGVQWVIRSVNIKTSVFSCIVVFCTCFSCTIKYFHTILQSKYVEMTALNGAIRWKFYPYLWDKALH